MFVSYGLHRASDDWRIGAYLSQSDRDFRWTVQIRKTGTGLIREIGGITTRELAENVAEDLLAYYSGS